MVLEQIYLAIEGYRFDFPGYRRLGQKGVKEVQKLAKQNPTQILLLLF